MEKTLAACTAYIWEDNSAYFDWTRKYYRNRLTGSNWLPVGDIKDFDYYDLVVTNQHGHPSVYRNDLRDAAQPDRGPTFVGLLLEGDGTRSG